MVEIIISFIILLTFIFMVYRYIKSYIILNKYKNIKSVDELSGLEVAEKLLENNGLDNIYIVETKNYIEENYDVKRKVIRLLPKSFHGTNICDCINASFLAAHIMIDKKNDKILYIRNFFLPFINILVYISYIVIILAAFLKDFNFIRLGIVLLFITILFNIITLKLEFSARDIVIKEYKKLNYINNENELVISELLSVLSYRYIYNPITLIVILFNTK